MLGIEGNATVFIGFDAMIFALLDLVGFADRVQLSRVLAVCECANLDC